ncbi:tetratricopeptide repeat protein [Massilia sp. DWR3-1-1]|uniref:tetratricopeptide repeat protein n=1 Tax=Massilia sp. DWR3-1-1 TaxID=2804559 RepID=UPI003CE7D105
MENYRFTLPLLSTPGKLTTVYAVDGGAARNAVLTTMASLLAERARASVPVLMIDWDTEAPGLHDEFGDRAGPARPARSQPGLIEYFAACREQLALLRDGPVQAGVDDDDADAAGLRRARQVFEAVDWEPFIERVDASRPLYLMRAGCFDDSYGERAAGADWEGLFAASPSLFRCFAEHLGRRFAHVLVASRGGRSAAVSVCTSLLADRLVTLFSPSRRSLDGICGVVRRAIEYRASHEMAQRPLLVYPLPVDLDGADQARRLRWRHGEAGSDDGGYQSVLEQLLRDSYALPELSLDSYLDHVQLQQLNPMAQLVAPRLPQTVDRFSLARGVADLLDWAADGCLPWQGRAELALSHRIAGARAADPDGVSPAVQAALAADLFELGRMQQQHGRKRQALASVTEAATLQAALWGAGHADTRAGRQALGAQLRHCGQPEAALALYRCLFDECVQDLGHGHPDTLAARAGVAAALADCQQFEAALAHAEQVVAGWRERCGLSHRATLAAQAAHAGVLARAGDASRARMLLEQVLEGRERVLGLEHADTLESIGQLAVILRQMGQLDNARSLQEQLLASRQRLLGGDHADTIETGLALADTLAAQCDLHGVGELCVPLAAACQRRYGRSEPATRSAELTLASRLAAQGGALPPAAAPLPPAWRAAGAPHESGFSAGPHDANHTGRSSAGHDARAIGAIQGAGRGLGKPYSNRQADPSDIERSVIRLEQMEDRGAVEARELADCLREPVLTADVAPMVRARGVRAILEVYFYQGDTDALVAFMQEQGEIAGR